MFVLIVIPLQKWFDFVQTQRNKVGQVTVDATIGKSQKKI